MKRRQILFYSPRLNDLRELSFSGIDYIVVKDCGGFIDRGIVWTWIGLL